LRRSLAALALLPIAVPGVVTGIGLASLWNAGPLAGWHGPVVWIGCAARFAAFAMGAMVAALLQVDRSLEEAAAVAGASWWQGMRHVVVPLIRRGMLAGWAIVFILSMREVATSMLVHPPGRDTLAIQLFQMMHYGADAQVAALGVILIVVTVLVVALVARPILAGDE
jgi:iron(III) transport system permease protein